MPVTPADLGKLPLFANITEAHLEEMLRAFKKEEVAAGVVLFEAGSVPDRLIVLASGEVILRQEGEDRFRVSAIAPLGELGSLTGLARSTTAVTATPCELLVMSQPDMLAFFEAHGDIAFPFHANLLAVATDKLRRDRQRLEEMRHNLIVTQRAMKRMSDVLLEAEDTPLHEQLYEDLHRLIEQNKKGHYQVEPSKWLPTKARFDDGREVEVVALSTDALLLGSPAPKSTDGRAAFVLMLWDREIPVSGAVEGDDGRRIKLDLLVEEYAQVLSDHLTRLLMLDVIL